jgi:predicted transcriptional regulator
MKNRSRTSIIGEMLQTATLGANKTKLMYSALLSYGQLSAYIKYLEERDLMAFDQKQSLYWVTPKGKRFLKICEELETMIGLGEPRSPLQERNSLMAGKPTSTVQ